MKPTVIIIGRPNVGKSTLFNRLVGKKLALVDDQPGVTRDRRQGDAVIAGLEFTIVDTAGWEDEDAETLPGRMRAQTEVSIEGADAVLFVIDARAGLTPLDNEIARWLRTEDVPVVAVANKAEGKAGDGGLYEAFSLGFGDPVALSAEHGEGVADLFEALYPLIGHYEAEREAADLAGEPADPDDLATGPLKLAIVGRPNAGKSTLINRMLGQDRLLTGPEAGITRDSIAVDWQWTDPDGEVRDVRLIDTAGMRKRALVVDKLEKLAVADAKHAVDFAEVVVLLLDATRGLEHQDLKIASHVIEEGRALMVAINKWDLAGSEEVGDASRLFNGIRGALEDGLSQVKGLSVFAVSAKTGKGIDQMLKAAFEIREAWSKRVPTSALNRWFDDALEANPPPAPKGKRIKLRYITQAGTRPPRFVVFGTRLDMLPRSYERYLVNSIRKELGFDAVPVRVVLKSPKNPYAKD
ncbi:ribosome biogenesis GTPase Der [Tsuneonella amylolytica]|uniref:ribosome biogenesis GTPase Der n=1 Tax=Tsuneonella amylolytica TaxID=2338327 RepID=UPI000EA8E074|nr:ribosome biogenesis GTPase Der [Tsuneonella amylolytica]